MEGIDGINSENLDKTFEDAKWKVVFSDNFKNAFEKVISDVGVKKAVVYILLAVASGSHPKKLGETECPSSLQTVYQFKVNDYWVVYTIDIMKEFNYIQYIKVWDILGVNEVPALLARLASVFDTYTDDVIKRCKERCLATSLVGYHLDIRIPKSWPISHDIIRFKSINNRNYVENCEVRESLLLMKFYAMTTRVVDHFLSNLNTAELDIPFEVTDEEREIILLQESCFILGRSGTGKTTVLAMKLYKNIERQRLASDGLRHEGESGGSILRQLFVTANPKLCYVFKQHLCKLKRYADVGEYNIDEISVDMDNMDDMVHFEDVPDSFMGIEPHKYPLVVTFKKFLMMLDGTVGNSYFDKFRAVRVLPPGNESLQLISVETLISAKEVDYNRFCCFYWPRFDKKLIKNLDATRVFSEIMACIKMERCLSRNDYVSLANRATSTLDESERSDVYDMYEAYDRKKKERGEFDLADFVIDIHERLKNQDLPGDRMDFLYVDEVQDLTISQISLFRYICDNIATGFVFAGDTAQTISKGVDFRFADLRSLFYKEFLTRSKSDSGNKLHISSIKKLSQNFRTHSGVLTLAQNVIDLLTYFFPQSVDRLAPETSLIYGEPPIILDSGSDENALLTIFGAGDVDNKFVGFGAQQVILVRDESTREEISKYTRGHALIMTISECKGLEFQDVLLYNYFGSSPMKTNHWRILYEFLKKKTPIESKSPTFSSTKHRMLSHELKQLYVAITRVRQRLWICEKRDEEFSHPMLHCWQQLGLVHVRKLDNALAQGMKTASTQEDWKTQGVKLYYEGLHEVASMCFERAGEVGWETQAKAAGLRVSAGRLHASNFSEASKMLKKAAELFQSVGKTELGQACLSDLEEYEKDERLCRSKESSDARAMREKISKLSFQENPKKINDQCIEAEVADAESGLVPVSTAGAESLCETLNHITESISKALNTLEYTHEEDGSMDPGLEMLGHHLVEDPKFHYLTEKMRQAIADLDKEDEKPDAGELLSAMEECRELQKALDEDDENATPEDRVGCSRGKKKSRKGRRGKGRKK